MEQSINLFMLPPSSYTPNPRRQLSSKDWEAQRAKIERFYAAEGFSLKQVREMMQKEGFRATYAPYSYF